MATAIGRGRAGRVELRFCDKVSWGGEDGPLRPSPRPPTRTRGKRFVMGFRRDWGEGDGGEWSGVGVSLISCLSVSMILESD